MKNNLITNNNCNNSSLQRQPPDMPISEVSTLGPPLPVKTCKHRFLKTNQGLLYLKLKKKYLELLLLVLRCCGIARSNEILGWEGVGKRQLLCFSIA
jgi:hypothetical protein